jgi:hypothetical protein
MSEFSVEARTSCARSATATCARSTTSRCTCPPARSSDCSDPTVRARRRWCASCRRFWRRRSSGSPPSPVSTSCEQPNQVRRHHRPRWPVRDGGRKPHRLREPTHGRPFQSHGQVLRRRKVGQLLADFGLADADNRIDQDLLRRHATSPRPGGRARRRSPDSLSGRTDDGPRPTELDKTSGPSSRVSSKGGRRYFSRRSTSKRPIDSQSNSSSSITARSSPKARLPRTKEQIGNDGAWSLTFSTTGDAQRAQPTDLGPLNPSPPTSTAP